MYILIQIQCIDWILTLNIITFSFGMFSEKAIYQIPVIDLQFWDANWIYPQNFLFFFDSKNL